MSQLVDSGLRLERDEPEQVTLDEPGGRFPLTSDTAVAQETAETDRAGHPVSFKSILYETEGPGQSEPPQVEPDYFHDLNLDQVLAGVIAGRDEYDLKPFFYDRLKTVDSILYRHEVMRDLEKPPVRDCIKALAGEMRRVREKLARADKLYYKLQKERWFLHAVEIYCSAVQALNDGLRPLSISSRGLIAFQRHVAAYVQSDRFTKLLSATDALAAGLDRVRYTVLMTYGGFRVRRYDDEGDYSADVTDTFRKFQQGAVKDYRVDFRRSTDMNHIEAKILDFVALLHPELFGDLARFCVGNKDFVDPVLRRFDREVQFYIGYLEYINVIRQAGLEFSYPELSRTTKHIRDERTFDLALASKLVAQKSSVVGNDFHLEGEERIFIVSGPNQGGKTTFARAFGQVHHLANIGCPVPGRNARLLLFDAMFAHFERAEDIGTLNGKLQDDLVRIHGILERATPQSIVIMNEIFTSTMLRDAVFLARKIIDRIIDLDCLCVCVTFLDELASISAKTVSMTSMVVPDNPAQRTFKVVRRPADGRSYAMSIAEKYGVTYERLRARIRS